MKNKNCLETSLTAQNQYTNNGLGEEIIGSWSLLNKSAGIILPTCRQLAMPIFLQYDYVPRAWSACYKRHVDIILLNASKCDSYEWRWLGPPRPCYAVWLGLLKPHVDYSTRVGSPVKKKKKNALASCCLYALLLSCPLCYLPALHCQEALACAGIVLPLNAFEYKKVSHADQMPRPHGAIRWEKRMAQTSIKLVIASLDGQGSAQRSAFCRQTSSTWQTMPCK